MNPSILKVSLVAAVAGAAAAGVTTLALTRSEVADTAANAVAPPEAAGPRQDEGLLAEVDALSAENRELRARIEALESRPIPDARTAIEPSVGQLPTSVAAAQGDASSAALPQAEFQARVAAAIEAIRTQERAEAARERDERELARMEERLTEMTERLALSPGQVKDMRAFMLAERDARAELDRLRDQGADREAYRLAREDQRKREVAELTRILTPDQYKTLQERERRDERGGPPSGRGQGGGRGG